MADIVLQNLESLPLTTKFTYKDMGDGTYAPVTASVAIASFINALNYTHVEKIITTVSQVVVPANPNRKYLLFINDSDTTIYLNLAGAYFRLLLTAPSIILPLDSTAGVMLALSVPRSTGANLLAEPATRIVAFFIASTIGGPDKSVSTCPSLAINSSSPVVSALIDIIQPLAGHIDRQPIAA